MNVKCKNSTTAWNSYSDNGDTINHLQCNSPPLKNTLNGFVSSTARHRLLFQYVRFTTPYLRCPSTCVGVAADFVPTGTYIYGGALNGLVFITQSHVSTAAAAAGSSVALYSVAIDKVWVGVGGCGNGDSIGHLSVSMVSRSHLPGRWVCVVSLNLVEEDASSSSSLLGHNLQGNCVMVALSNWIRRNNWIDFESASDWIINIRVPGIHTMVPLTASTHYRSMWWMCLWMAPKYVFVHFPKCEYWIREWTGICLEMCTKGHGNRK